MNPFATDRERELTPDRLALLALLRERGRSKPAAGRTAVPLRAAKRGTPQLLLLHPAGGELFCYTPLIRSLQSEIAVFGFAAEPADVSVPPQKGIETVAERLLPALPEHGPRDALALAGWSYGGVLAFELARRLERERGLTPPVLVLDGLYYGDVELEDEATLRRRFVHDVARLSGKDDATVRAALAGPAAPRADTGSHPGAEPDPAAIRESLAALDVELDLTDRELWERYAIFRFCALSLQCYSPSGPYSGPVTVLTTEERAGVAERWRTACTGPFECVEIPGDHYTLFAGEPLDTVVTHIEKALASLQAVI